MLASMIENEGDPDALDTRFIMLLHAHTLKRLNEPLFIFRLISRLKRELRHSKSSQVIHRPIRQGVSYIASEMLFDDFFSDLTSANVDFEGLGDIMQLRDALDTAWGMQSYQLRRFNDLRKKTLKIKYGADDAEGEVAIDYVVECAEIHLWRLAAYCRKSSLYPQLRPLYATEIADRILHDRLASAHLAHQLVWLSPPGKDGGGGQFVSRCRCPPFVLRTVYARDRGRCSRCSVDLAQELLAAGDIDHIVPISCGGCNDLVNLQLLCAKCDSEKGANLNDIETSIPRYHSAALNDYLKRLSYTKRFND